MPNNWLFLLRKDYTRIFSPIDDVSGLLVSYINANKIGQNFVYNS